MFKKFIAFCLKNPWVVVTAALVTAVTAVRIFVGLPVDVLPELNVPRVVVQTEAGGMTAEEVEQFVTMPIEAAMSGVPGVRTVRSSSGGGLSFVWVDFDWGTDIFRARYSVSEKLATVREALPAEAEPEISPVVSVSGEIMMVALTSDGATPMSEVRRLAEYDLRNRLLAIPGVGQVVALGGELPEVRVAVSQDRLLRHGVSIADVVDAAAASRTTAGAGYLADVRGREIPLRQIARADSPEELRRATIPGTEENGRSVALRDVAKVSFAGAPRRGSAGFNGEDAVVFAIQKMPGGNTLELTKKIDAALDVFEASRLPAGVTLHREAYRQSEFIGMAIRQGNLILRDAAVIVILVLVFTLMRVRTTLITLLSMPLSLFAGLVFFPKFGLGVNVMTLGGLAVAVGDVVDSSIIFVELAWRRLEENAAKSPPKQQPKWRVLYAAAVEIANSVTFSTLIIVLVFMPMLFLVGIEGQFFRPLAIAFLLVFFASLIISLTVTPVLCLLMFTKKSLTHGLRKNRHGDAEGFSVRLLKRTYRPMLRFCMKHAGLVCALMTALTVFALMLAATFGTGFLPPFHENCYTVSVSTPPGTSLAETERATNEAAKILSEIDGVLSVTRRTGRAEKDEHAEPVSASELVVRVDMRADARRLRADIERVVHGIPGVSTLIGYPIAHRISAVLSGTNAELAINIYGDDLDVLRQTVAKVKSILDTLPQIADVRANREVLVDTLKIAYRIDALTDVGLTLKDAGEQVSAAFNGIRAGVISRNENRWDVVVRLEEPERASPADVAAFKLTTPSGERVRLSEVADVYREESSNLIVRDNAKRKALISGNVAPDSNVGDLVAALRKHVEPVVYEAGCTIGYGGSYEAQQSASRRLGLAGGVVLALILLILTYSLRNLKSAVLVMLNLPLCLIGGIVAMFLCAPAATFANIAALFGYGTYIAPIVSVSAIVGFVTAMGFVVRNGLLLLNKYDALRSSGMNVRDAVEAGSVERMIPIIMTSLTTILGLLPLVAARDKPGGELLAPLAVVQFGGLLCATFLNLLVLPAAYWLANRKAEKTTR